MACNVAWSAVQPVGFAGELTKMTRVRSVTAADSLSISQNQPLAECPSGTETALAPATSVAPAKFGQSGVRQMTSSPAPAVACSDSWIACMPEPTTRNSSRAKRLPKCRSW